MRSGESSLKDTTLLVLGVLEVLDLRAIVAAELLIRRAIQLQSTVRLLIRQIVGQPEVQKYRRLLSLDGTQWMSLTG